MQTFLPYKNFYKVAQCLDNKRLNKQIVEAYQIISGKLPTKNHPAYLMWINNLDCLNTYTCILCEEWTRRTSNIHKVQQYIVFNKNIKIPIWLTNKFCFIHQVNLLRKDYNYYSQYFKISNLNSFPEGYFWPIVKNKNTISYKHSMSWIEYFKNNNL